ncbi:DCN1-like protein 3 [Watersipora subatra]|uniref:DCN1-like protein 3 n=1 Tax=Watersipora subatra TaxID=2589382 RepID=UPI00355B2635
MGCINSSCMPKQKDTINNGVAYQDPPSVNLTSLPAPSSKPPVDASVVTVSIVQSPQPNLVSMAMGDSSSIMNLYNKYVNREMGQISAEGVEELCNDLDLNPEDFRVLVLAYSLGAQVMCRFTEDEFVKGCKKHSITSIRSMKQAIPRLLNNVQRNFGDFYRWTYKFALDIESGQRTLPTEMALSLWKLVFYQNYPTILDRWLNYLENHTKVKGISKDTWDMFLIFIEQVGEDLQSYDDSEAWPSLLDDFVEHELSDPTGM